MSYFVYALRDRPTGLIRYIGQSLHPEHRFVLHLNTAKAMPRPTNFADWLMTGDAEVVELDSCHSREGAVTLEKALIRSFVALGHPLFNVHGVPADKRLPRHGWPQAA